MVINQEIKKKVKEVIRNRYNLDIDFMVERPPADKKEDFAINVAFLLGKELKKKPIEIANELKDEMRKIDIIKDDAEDNKVLECALSANAEYIMTYDKHLLNISEYKGIKIMKPDDFLKIISMS